ncbi:chondroadherin-like [Branchiostoma floridae]|uniref:Chondroadherin-like n=2 Tax=Branchiostoma floridae TaxID=7739 RepID=A0A9J7MGF0_BRAFL|nr:chondroadherin-like [Branchiostoma floridae]
MPNKARRLLVLLLIILKEAGPTAACSSSCSSDCSCSNRGLTGVPQDLPTDITWLKLESNAITTLSQTDFSRYKRLIILHLHSNQISMIHNKTFRNLTSLTWLELGENQLTTLPADIFVGLGNLQTLSLWRNEITSLAVDIFVGLGNLRYLYLHSNQLTTLPADIFVGLGNLHWLSLDRNDIHSIQAGTFHDTTQLRILKLEYNNIRTIPAHTFGNQLQLEELRLNHNNISTFPLEALSKLNISLMSKLILNNNQMETLPAMAYDILASVPVREAYLLDDLGPTVIIENNPWQCDCRMAPFRQRMNGSYPFEAEIRCAGPGNLAGQLLQDVNPEDLICEETTPIYSTSKYDTVADINQQESPHHENMQGLDSFGYLVLPPPLPPENLTGPQADAHNESGDEADRTVGGHDTWADDTEYDDVISRVKSTKEDPQSHKYENNQMIEDAAASPRDIVYDNDDESVDNQSQKTAAGADSPNHYEPLRNPSGQHQHTYTSLLPHDLQH